MLFIENCFKQTKTFSLSLISLKFNNFSKVKLNVQCNFNYKLNFKHTRNREGILISIL